MKSIRAVYIILTLGIILSIGYLNYGVTSTHKKLKENFEQVFVLQAEEFAKNIDLLIKSEVNGSATLYEILKRNPSLRDDLEKAISTIVTPSFKYAYVLYRDKKGRYRYLLDGSREDKGFFNQKLDVDKEKWNRSYETKKDQVLIQKNLEGLWITYLKPIIRNRKVDSVIAIDFSTALPVTIDNATKPLENIFHYIFAAIALLFSILLLQSYINYRTKKASLLDPLTNTYNRSYLREFLQSENPANYQVMMVDIDHFKKINDIFGHKAGDIVLQDVAALIKSELRERDKIVRFGGEEFLIFLHKEKLDCIAANNISKRLKEKIENRVFKYENTPIHITVSIGITVNPEHYKSFTEAIKKADEMLYVAKREGRNKIIFDFEGDKKSVSTQNKTLSEVKEALDEDRVICHFQPILELNNKRVVKYEALVRLVERDGTVVLPFKFLPTISYTNIYNDLTKRVLSIVFKEIEKHKTPISINLNITDLLDNMIFTTITSEIESRKDVSQWLVIELLENEHNSDSALLKDRVLTLKSYGVKIAIDDFGSGFSNFSIFQELPIDILKIDGSLIKEIDTSEVAYSITESISLFANKLGIETVAEFIHSKEIMLIVKDMGISHGQGFYLGKPQEKISSSKEKPEQISSIRAS